MPTKGEIPITPQMGTLYPICDFDHATVTLEMGSPASIRWTSDGTEASFTIKIPFRKMSRKRFVKKLMAKGLSRNSANFAAKLVENNSSNYRNDYLMITFFGGVPLGKRTKQNIYHISIYRSWRKEQEPWID